MRSELRQQMRSSFEGYSLVKIEDEPRVWKHACIYEGVVEKSPYSYSVKGEMLRYIVCDVCKKVIYVEV